MVSKPAHGPAHRVRQLIGRDPNEAHRVASSLELLFDLTFAIAFGQAGNAVSHLLAEGHFLPAFLGFVISTFAIYWAWVNFSWFASAYDTDDWFYRVTTLLQMIGVLVFAMGLPRLFTTLGDGQPLDNRVMVLGYIIMRLAMLIQWLRVWRADPSKPTSLYYIKTIVVAQIGWTALAFLHLPTPYMVMAMIPLAIIEVAGPYLAEQHGGTPWHAHHIAERYSLLAIIALGECLIGTISTLSASVDARGWTWESALVAFSGATLTFAMWWVYTILPSAEVLHVNRNKAFLWGYLHYITFGAIAATGAGLHVIAYFIEHNAHISAVGAITTVVVPVALYGFSISGLYLILLGRAQLINWITLVSLVIYGLVLALAAAGVPVAICLFILMLAPVLVVMLDEWIGTDLRTQRLAEQHSPRASHN